MKGFLDPVKNAKVVGILILIGVVLRMSGLRLAMSILGFSFYVILLMLMVALIPLAVGIGLIMHKKWAIYGLGVLGVLGIFFAIQNNFNGDSLFWAIVYVLLFIWFWLARDRFGSAVPVETKSN